MVFICYMRKVVSNFFLIACIGKNSIIQYKFTFDAIETYVERDNGKEHIEVWFAMDLQKVLGYARWENFQTAINRAVESCNTQGVNVDDHFREVTKMVCRRESRL